MKRVALIAVVLALAGSVHAESASQFDVVCQLHTVMTTSSSGPAVSDGEVRYSIDLDRKEWCLHDCQHVGPIVEVTPSRLGFTPAGGDPKNSNDLWTIDRTTGAYQAQGHIGPTNGFEFRRVTTGACVKAPFTPLPAAMF